MSLWWIRRFTRTVETCVKRPCTALTRESGAGRQMLPRLWRPRWSRSLSSASGREAASAAPVLGAWRQLVGSFTGPPSSRLCLCSVRHVSENGQKKKKRQLSPVASGGPSVGRVREEPELWRGPDIHRPLLAPQPHDRFRFPRSAGARPPTAGKWGGGMKGSRLHPMEQGEDVTSSHIGRCPLQWPAGEFCGIDGNAGPSSQRSA